MKRIILYLMISISWMAVFAQTALKPGDTITDFSKIPAVDGRSVNLSDFNDQKGVILIFSCNHCPYVILYEDRITLLHEKFAPLGFPVVAICSNDTVAYPEDGFLGMVARAEEKNFKFTYAMDGSQDIARYFGASRTPEVFVLQNVNNNWIVRYTGAIDDNPSEAENTEDLFTDAAVTSLLAGKEISKPVTKSIGCSVKYRN